MIDHTVPLDKQQLFVAGDPVLRRIDVAGTSWRKGTVTDVELRGAVYFYHVAWEDGTTGACYMGSSLVRPPDAAAFQGAQDG